MAFQTNREDRYAAHNEQFDHVNTSNIKLFLNSESFPQSNLNLNFANGIYGTAYQMYYEFQISYYNKYPPSPIIQYTLYGPNYPLFGIDCSKQDERIKYSANDIRVEIQTSAAIPANTVIV